MSTLTLKLLGTPQILLDNTAVDNLPSKAEALLFYLAGTGKPQTRTTLATLLWGERTEKQARKNLRNALSTLRTVLGQHLAISRQQIAFAAHGLTWFDIQHFSQLLADDPAQLSIDELLTATNLFENDFLNGFYIRDAPMFEEWMLLQQEYLRNLAVQGLEQLAKKCIDTTNADVGLAATQRLLVLAPESETAHQLRMTSLAKAGQRYAALAQYDTCCRVLREELAISPMTETVSLYEAIKAGQFDPNRPSPHPTSTIQPSRPEVDWDSAPILSPFVGRQSELDQLSQWLFTEKTNLVGIFGLGGQGKTALAVQLAEALAQNRLPDGTNLIDKGFQQIVWRSARYQPSLDQLISDWLVQLSGHSLDDLPKNADEQLRLLLKQLRQKRTLLILDDLEALCQGGDFGADWQDLLRKIVHRSHSSCLMVIGREKPRTFGSLAIDSRKVQSMALNGLTPDEGQTALNALGLVGELYATRRLVNRYAGNPKALKLASLTIQIFFNGHTVRFLHENMLIFGEIHNLLDSQFTQLSDLEQQVLTELTIVRQPIPFAQLWRRMAGEISKRHLLETLQRLQYRFMLDKYKDGFAPHPLFAEYLLHELFGDMRTVREEDFSDVAYPVNENGMMPQTERPLEEQVYNGNQQQQVKTIAVQLASEWGKAQTKQHLKNLPNAV